MPDLFAPPATELQKIGVAAFPTPGQGLALDQSGKIPRGVGTILVLNKEFMTVDVASSNSEASVSFSNVVANSMGATGALRLTLFGDILYNNNAADTLRLRVKFGGSAQFDYTVTNNQQLSATRAGWMWQVLVANRSAPNSQFVISTFGVGVSNVGGTTNAGIGSYPNILSLNTGAGGSAGGLGAVSGSAAIDTSLDQILTATVQWSASSANDSFRKQYSMLELF